MINLSQRLRCVAGQVSIGSILADIGSDHALLPVYLLQRGIIVSAVAGEINLGPYLAAQKQVKEAGLQTSIAVRQGDGLEVLAAGEANVITIAGMGGQLIVHILSEGSSKLQDVKRLILQPNVGEEQVRRWLFEQGWFLIHEQIVEEDCKIYEIFTAERCDDPDTRNRELYRGRSFANGGFVSVNRMFAMGPYLLFDSNQEGIRILKRKWEDEIRKLEKICESLLLSTLNASVIRLNQIQLEINEIKGVLQCLPKDKP